jgi:hypothetical protein
MKILLDECLPLDFRHSVPGHDAHTVQWAGLKGKNGELLQTAAAFGYEALLTVDLGFPRPESEALAIVLIRSRTNQLADLVPLAAAIDNALQSIRPGEVVVVSLP